MTVRNIIVGLSLSLLLTSCVVHVKDEPYDKTQDEFWYERRADPWDNIEAEDDIIGIYINGEKVVSQIKQRHKGDGPYYNMVESYFRGENLVICAPLYKCDIWKDNLNILIPKDKLERGKTLEAIVIRGIEGTNKYQNDTLANASICFDSVYAVGDYTHIIGHFEFEGVISDTLQVVGTKGVFHDKTRMCFFPDSFYN